MSKPAPQRSHDRLGRPFLIDRHARIGPKGTAVEYGAREVITPVKRAYTLADDTVFKAALVGLVANATVCRNVLSMFRDARAEKALTAEYAHDLLSAAVAGLRGVSDAQARTIVSARADRILAPSTAKRAPTLLADARSLTRSDRSAMRQRMRRHRIA